MISKVFKPVVLLVCAAIFLAACAPQTQAMPPAVTDMPAQSSGNYAGKKIVWINSYHEGYAWSDGIAQGLHSVLDGTGIELKVIALDTKQNPDPAFGEAAGAKAKTEIDAFKPDIVIASDDNAQKYVVMPYLKGTTTPVIFNGVNWDASAYGYAGTNVTGMLEVELPNQLYDLMKAYAKGERLGYVTIDTETERKITDIYNQRFFGGKMQVYWAKTQDEFQANFIKAQQEVDILFLGNNAGSDKWDDEAMKQFILNNTSIPTCSINDWMAPYALLTLAKSAQEQGEWSAKTALQILDGASATNIIFAENKKGQLMVNLPIADKLKIVIAPSLLKNATIIDK